MASNNPANTVGGDFSPAKRPNFESVGRQIALRTNFFRVKLPKGDIHHYDLSISPDKCPRRVNRDIVEAMVSTYHKVFGEQRPVFDGRKNLYSSRALPIGKKPVDFHVTLPMGNSKDKTFKVTVKWVAQVSLFALEQALEGKHNQIPFEAIQALDVVLRHLPSMKYTSVGRSFFSPPEDYYHPLESGREVWFGFHQSVRPSQWKMMLNIDGKSNTVGGDFSPPKRPNFGSVGRQIALRTNFFRVKLPKGDIHHYDLSISPDKCPRRVNRDIVEAMVSTYHKVFGEQRPVFDGRKNLYSSRALPIGRKPGCIDGYSRRIIWLEVGVTNSYPDVTAGYFLDAIHSVGRVPRILRADNGTENVHIAAFQRFFRREEVDAFGGEKSFMYGRSVSNQRIEALWDQLRKEELNKAAKLWNLHRIRPSTNLESPPRRSDMLYFLAEIINTEDYKTVVTTDDVELDEETCGLQNVQLPCSPEFISLAEIIMRENVLLIPTNANDAKALDIKLLEKIKEVADNLYPHLPCLQVGQEQKHTYLPMEVCNLVAGQRCIKRLTDQQTAKMIRATAKKAPDRENEILNLVRKADFKNDPYAIDFGISISDNMVELAGRILEAPKLQYGGRLYLCCLLGVWDMRGKHLYHGIEIHTWAIACFVNPQDCSDRTLKNFTGQLMKISGETGMPIRSEPCFCRYAKKAEDVEPMFKYLMSTFSNLQLIILVLPGKTPVYAEVKRVGDTALGIATQCVQAKNIAAYKPQTLSNLCLKINAKLGGINSILAPDVR
ncbi:PREDICTED: protein argonaute-3-like [Acropora digitifera]|uniref:protein argonaute-3-like n=1 Tax=Acropora digitifera TaxID=70779 RepID=UPI00077A0A16|nr:PREDICTED: protein argonaute-3-like [Acropora digitifera]